MAEDPRTPNRLIQPETMMIHSWVFVPGRRPVLSLWNHFSQCAAHWGPKSHPGGKPGTPCSPSPELVDTLVFPLLGLSPTTLHTDPSCISYFLSRFSCVLGGLIERLRPPLLDTELYPGSLALKWLSDLFSSKAGADTEMAASTWTRECDICHSAH